MADHRQELTISDILALDRDGLVRTLLGYRDEVFDVSLGYLRRLSDTRLRRLLVAVRRYRRMRAI